MQSSANFIPTNVGDWVGQTQVRKTGAWMSDDLMLEQFNSIVER